MDKNKDSSILKLYRRKFEHFSLGIVYLKNKNLYTIERPWVPSKRCIGGTPFESCVPYGMYKLVDFQGKKFGSTKALFNEELGVYPLEQGNLESGTYRFACLNHAANYVEEVVGCIAWGTGVAPLRNGGYMVTGSRDAMGIFNSLNPKMLEILPYEPAS